MLKQSRVCTHYEYKDSGITLEELNHICGGLSRVETVLDLQRAPDAPKIKLDRGTLYAMRPGIKAPSGLFNSHENTLRVRVSFQPEVKLVKHGVVESAHRFHVAVIKSFLTRYEDVNGVTVLSDGSIVVFGTDYADWQYRLTVFTVEVIPKPKH